MAESKIDNGGPAFARAAAETSICGNYDQEGMSLRDYFAGQALTGMGTWAPLEQAEWSNRDMVQKMRAEWAYEQADAMIAARKAGA